MFKIKCIYARIYFFSAHCTDKDQKWKNVKTMINWLETVGYKESKGSSIWVNIANIPHGTNYQLFACMRTFQSTFRNHMKSSNYIYDLDIMDT